jgi:SAM-dependent methyltransferase
MKKLYQSEWHNISFKSFSKISSKRIADETFYHAFYEQFFKKYSSWSDLDPQWLELKKNTADFIKKNKKIIKESKILSIGCGLGLIEKTLIEEGFVNLEINEVSINPLTWLSPYIAANKIHIGQFPDCLPTDCHFDFIYLAGIEYFFDQNQLIQFLRLVKDRLKKEGICLLISWSIDKEDEKRILIKIKEFTKQLLISFGFLVKYRQMQFWGYIRKRADFFEAMFASGFSNIRDGFLKKNTKWDTYWIEGINS